MAHTLSSPYLRYDLSESNAPWHGDIALVTTALGTVEVKPRSVDSVLVPVHLSTNSEFVSHVSGAQGYACYDVADGAQFDRHNVMFENALGDRQRVSTSTITQLCAALNQHQDHEATETRHLLCADAWADDWAHGPVVVNTDTAILDSGTLQVGTAAERFALMQSFVHFNRPPLTMKAVYQSCQHPIHRSPGNYCIGIYLANGAKCADSMPRYVCGMLPPMPPSTSVQFVQRYRLAKAPSFRLL